MDAAQGSSVLSDLLPSAEFMNPVPDVASIPLMPVSTVPAPVRAPTPPTLRQELDDAAARSGATTPASSNATEEVEDDEEEEEGMRTPRASEMSPLPATMVVDHLALQNQQQPSATLQVAIRPRPPMWLDGAIAFFAIMIAYVAGRRVSYVWEYVTDHI